MTFSIFMQIMQMSLTAPYYLQIHYVDIKLPLTSTCTVKIKRKTKLPVKDEETPTFPVSQVISIRQKRPELASYIDLLSCTWQLYAYRTLRLIDDHARSCNGSCVSLISEPCETKSYFAVISKILVTNLFVASA